MVGLPILARVMLSLRVWYAEDPLFQFFQFIEIHLGFFYVVGGLLIWLFLTYFFIARTTNYLDEMLKGTKKLLQEPSEHIELSENLAQFEEELNQIRKESLFHQRAASEAEQRKNDLIVYLAHDLRTPLTSIIGYLTLLQEAPDLTPEQRAHYLGIAVDKAYRLESLINEFFEITKFNLSGIDLEKQPTNLSVMVAQIASEFEPLLQEKGLAWEQQITPDIWLEIDTEKFERVLDNFIRNGIAYAAADTVLRLSVYRDTDTAVLTFQNKGTRISPEKLNHIFDPFFRGDAARSSDTGGAGLGLSISKEIIEGHGGTLAAHYEGEWFTLIAHLPLSGEENQ